MTLNERLFACGVFDKWEEAVRRRSRQEMVEILCSVGLTGQQAAQTTDKVLEDPRKYGF
jgi:hypothetical protein